jgi:hypothetical protein
MVGQPIVAIDKDSLRITLISEVEQIGLKCNCVCGECSGPLEAVLNTDRKKHFRHHSKLNCTSSPETQLHLLAKHIVFNNDQLYIPGKGTIRYSNPRAEIKESNVVPDLTIEVDGRKIYVEIIVSNRVNEPKKGKYESLTAFVVLIDLSEEDRNMDYESLQQLVLFATFNKEVLDFSKVQPLVTSQAAKLGQELFFVAAASFVLIRIINLFRRE